MEVSDLRIIRISFCDVLILNIGDLFPDNDLLEVGKILRKLQPEKIIIKSEYGKVDQLAMPDTGLFGVDYTRYSAACLKNFKRNFTGLKPESMFCFICLLKEEDFSSGKTEGGPAQHS